MLVSGILFMLSGLLNIAESGSSAWAAVCSLNAVLFLGGGFSLLVVGMLLMNDVHVAPPGSLMVRRGHTGA